MYKQFVYASLRFVYLHIWWLYGGKTMMEQYSRKDHYVYRGGSWGANTGGVLEDFRVYVVKAQGYTLPGIILNPNWGKLV